jgi:hypothetical protein
MEAMIKASQEKIKSDMEAGQEEMRATMRTGQKEMEAMMNSIRSELDENISTRVLGALTPLKKWT